ncbi:unnamed protein product [Microthlaspi erraticum]|uniref:Uncharacterized protein n=1 Tax=Microthlaspi erraticum TaxID=1685480 RepID=A0A6D2JU03_9BRAS|nr:unnamed protein product [Microthlaspi erraticum]CAA7051413.1 unnamed protein product [Microthlaspi erraticum]
MGEAFLPVDFRRHQFSPFPRKSDSLPFHIRKPLLSSLIREEVHRSSSSCGGFTLSFSATNFRQLEVQIWTLSCPKDYMQKEPWEDSK